MLLSHGALCDLVRAHVLYWPASPYPDTIDLDQVNATSIDLTLGDFIEREAMIPGFNDLTLAAREQLCSERIDLRKTDGYTLQPGEFILAQSREAFNLPLHISAEYKLKSSMARNGLEHMNAGWCDAGWHGSVLTLELKNMTRHHTIHIRPGDRIGQMVFFEHKPVAREYSYAVRGRYNGDLTTTRAKP